MKKPNALIELIQELEEEQPDSAVEIYRESKVVVYTSNEALNQSDGISLTGKEALLLLANADAVERFAETVGGKDASIVIANIDMPETIMEALERNFLAVDEE